MAKQERNDRQPDDGYRDYRDRQKDSEPLTGPVKDAEQEDSSLATLGSASEAIGVVEAAAIDRQIATAKKYPRQITKVMQDATTLATMDPEIAASMFYRLPRGTSDEGAKKYVEGPSVRLAEVMAHAWTNLRIDAEVMGSDAKTVSARAVCMDLETNVAIRVVTKRKIIDRRGRRYNDDMVNVTGNAATKIALRNAVFTVIPASLVHQVWVRARDASTGKGTIESKREAARVYFTRLDVTEEELLRALGVRGWADVGEEELVTLRGIRTALEDGDGTVASIFRPEPSQRGRSAASDELAQAAAAGQAEAGESGQEPPGQPETAQGGQNGPLAVEPAARPRSARTAAQGPSGRPRTAPRAPEPPPAGPQVGQEPPQNDQKRPEAADPGRGAGDSQPGPVVDPGPSGGQEEAESDAPQAAPEPETSPRSATSRAGMIEQIETLETSLELSGGTQARRRRRFLGDVDLEGADNAALEEYLEHLRSNL